MIGAHLFQSASTSGLHRLVQGCLSNASWMILSARAIWAFGPGQRVRDSCSCQYISGSSTHPPSLASSGSAPCPPNRAPPSATKSRPGRDARELRATLVQVSSFAGNPCVAIKVSSAFTAPFNRHSTSAEVCRVESKRRQDAESARDWRDGPDKRCEPPASVPLRLVGLDHGLCLLTLTPTDGTPQPLPDAPELESRPAELAANTENGQ